MANSSLSKTCVSKEHIQYLLTWNNYISAKNNHQTVYEEHQYYVTNSKKTSN